MKKQTKNTPEKQAPKNQSKKTKKGVPQKKGGTTSRRGTP